jgi:hypothetical protein
MEIEYEMIDTWNENRIVYTGTKEQCVNYLRGNNMYQINYSKLQMKNIAEEE